MEMVKEIFCEEDAEIISGIHLSQRRNPDKLIWRDSNIGLLTVKSAYYMARRILGKKFMFRILEILYGVLYGKQG